MPKLAEPQALEAEKGIIAATMLADLRRGENPSEPDVIAEVRGDELERHFHSEPLRSIWRLMLDRHRRGEVNDLVAVADACRFANIRIALSDSTGLELTQWTEGLRNLVDMTTSVLFRKHAAEIREASIRRKKIAELRELARRLAEDHRPIAEWYSDSASSTLSELDTLRAEADLNHVVFDVMQRVVTVAESGSIEIAGVPSGIDVLDQHLGGFRQGNLIVVAGRPGMGKTSIALTVTLNCCRRRQRVGFISCEMTTAELVQRLIAQISGVEVSRLWRGPIGRAEYGRIVKASQEVTEFPLSIIDDQRSWPTVVNECERMVAKGAEILVIDYLGLLDLPDSKAPRWEMVSKISREALALPKRLNVPLLMLAQLNREVRHEAQKRPALWHLRDSGSIEQDANVVILLHRPGAYDTEARQDEAELIIGKNRNGPLGSVSCRWVGELARFEGWGTNSRTHGAGWGFDAAHNGDAR